MNTAPDVCNTPVPMGPVAVPYPNLAMPSSGKPKTKKVFISGSLACMKNTKFTPTTGDEPGTLGGIVSGTIQEKAEFITASTKTKLEGQPAVFQGCTTTHNNANTTGSVSACGQAVVIING